MSVCCEVYVIVDGVPLSRAEEMLSHEDGRRYSADTFTMYEECGISPGLYALLLGDRKHPQAGPLVGLRSLGANIAADEIALLWTLQAWDADYAGDRATALFDDRSWFETTLTAINAHDANWSIRADDRFDISGFLRWAALLTVELGEKAATARIIIYIG